MNARPLFLLTALAALSLATAAFPQTTAPAASPAWGAQDIHGKGVAVPADRTTVLLFLRPGQAQSADAMSAIAGILTAHAEVQVVGIVSGDEAKAAAGALEKTGFAYPIVADDNYDASGKFAVRVWPTVVVLGKKGDEIARMPGLPVTLANDLSAYLDFAAGKLDKAGLDKALANREVVSDSEDEKAGRHAEVAARLAQQGLSTQAAGEVAKALELKPASGKVIASLARTELILNDAKAADALLAKLTEKDIPPNELNTLKGWSALEAEQWDKARQLLEDATRLNPDPTEGLYLLGRIYEHAGDAAKAADAYRRAFEHTAEGKAVTGK